MAQSLDPTLQRRRRRQSRFLLSQLPQFPLKYPQTAATDCGNIVAALVFFYVAVIRMFEPQRRKDRKESRIQHTTQPARKVDILDGILDHILRRGAHPHGYARIIEPTPKPILLL
jgi:hypothetical protein